MPQQNRVVEKKNLTLQEMARAMLHAHNTLYRFWVEALNIACHIHNRIVIHNLWNLACFFDAFMPKKLKLMICYTCFGGLLETWILVQKLIQLLMLDFLSRSKRGSDLMVEVVWVDVFFSFFGFWPGWVVMLFCHVLKNIAKGRVCYVFCLGNICLRVSDDVVYCVSVFCFICSKHVF